MADFPAARGYVRRTAVDGDHAAGACSRVSSRSPSARRRRPDRASPACRSPACWTTSTPSAGTAPLGVTWQGNKPAFRSGRPPPRRRRCCAWERRRRPATRDAPRRRRATRLDGTWSVAGKLGCQGDEYRWARRRLRADHGAIETNEVTDPYSVALTLELDALGRHRPRRQGARGRRRGRKTPAPRRRPARRPDHLRAARARLLDRRRDRARGGARHLRRVHPQGRRA